METKYTIDLGNGTVLSDLTLNGNNYVSQTEVTEDTFEGMENVTITDSDGNEQTLNNVELVQCKKFEDGYYFVLREMTDAEVKQANNDAQILFTAVMTDTLLEE